MSTIYISKRLLGQLKVYCIRKNIKLKDVVRIILKRDKEFSKFINTMRRLKV